MENHKGSKRHMKGAEKKMGEKQKANAAAATQPGGGRVTLFPFCYPDKHHKQKRVGGGKCLFQLILHSSSLREVRRQEPGGRK